MAHSRIVVTGSREWSDPAADQIIPLLYRTIDELLAAAAAERGKPDPGPALITHGDARGLDRIAAEIAADDGRTVLTCPAQWDTHTAECPDWHHDKPTCKMAGHRRNEQMLTGRYPGIAAQAGGPVTLADAVIGFPAHPRHADGSRGTWGAIDAALRMNIPVFVYLRGDGLHPEGGPARGMYRRYVLRIP